MKSSNTKIPILASKIQHNENSSNAAIGVGAKVSNRSEVPSVKAVVKKTHSEADTKGSVRRKERGAQPIFTAQQPSQKSRVKMRKGPAFSVAVKKHLLETKSERGVEKPIGPIPNSDSPLVVLKRKFLLDITFKETPLDEEEVILFCQGKHLFSYSALEREVLLSRILATQKQHKNSENSPLSRALLRNMHKFANFICIHASKNDEKIHELYDEYCQLSENESKRDKLQSHGSPNFYEWFGASASDLESRSLISESTKLFSSLHLITRTIPNEDKQSTIKKCIFRLQMHWNTKSNYTKAYKEFMTESQDYLHLYIPHLPALAQHL